MPTSKKITSQKEKPTKRLKASALKMLRPIKVLKTKTKIAAIKSFKTPVPKTSKFLQIPSLTAIKYYVKKQAEKPLIPSKLKRKQALKNLWHSDNTAEKPVTKSFQANNIDHAELPTHYAKTWLTLFVKDPFWIFATWELSPGDIEQQLELILKIYEITDGDQQGATLDIHVGQANNWYVNLPKDNVSWGAQIGILKSSGEFIALAQSNIIHTPRAQYSERTEQIWMEVKDEEVQSPFVIMPPTRKIGDDFKTRMSVKRPWVLSITDDDIRRYYSRLMPFLYKVLGDRLAKFAARKLPLTFAHQLKKRKGVYALLPKRKFWLGASEQGEMWEEEELTAEGLKQQQLGGASSFLLGASEKHQQKQRKFFFELDANLTVYGRTEPNAEVWMGNKKLELRPDGTFSCFFAFPDGKIPLTFTAISGDKVETRTIAPTFVRQTRCELPVLLQGKIS